MGDGVVNIFIKVKERNVQQNFISAPGRLILWKYDLGWCSITRHTQPMIRLRRQARNSNYF